MVLAHVWFAHGRFAAVQHTPPRVGTDDPSALAIEAIPEAVPPDSRVRRNSAQFG